jgi:ABC-type bacteriocin/lantibiotic exporter with double-glycine peptidase domain
MAEATSLLTPTQRFWRLLKPDAREIRNVYIYSIFNALVYLSLPLGIQAIINLIQGGEITSSWIILVAVVVTGVIIGGLLQIFQLRIVENLQQKIFARAAFEFSYRLPRLRMEVLYKYYAPELMNRFFDIMTVQKGLAKMLIDLSTAFLYVIFGVLLLSLYHPFFILFSIILVLLTVTIFRFTLMPGLRTSLMESKHKYEVAHWLEEVARTNNTFKLAGVTDLPLQRVNGYVGQYINAREKHFRVLVQQYSLMVTFRALVTAGLLAMGGILVINQQMNIGQFVAAELLILMIMGGVEKLVLTMETVYDVLTGLEKVGQVTDLDMEKQDGVCISDTAGEKGLRVEMDRISFSYPDGKAPILNEISLKLDSGERVVLTGASGSGKSTLLYVIAGLYDVQQGSLAFNGLPKGNLDLISLRSAIGDCLEQEQLFQGTLLENITMGRSKATFARVQDIVARLGLDEFIRELPQGYDTVLDPMGKKLSNSTVKKLLLARSLADDPKLLLLENPLDSLDGRDRALVTDYLTDPSHTFTLVMVTSDPTLAARADRIVVLDEGRIVSDERGGRFKRT